MPTVYHDRIQENFTTTGTGDLTVTGAVSGYRAWSTLNDQDDAPYCAVDSATGAWEVGSALVTKAIAPDASFANVNTLFHANGSNLSATFNNDSTMSGAPTLSSLDSATVYLTTAQKKFGSASLVVPSPSSGLIKCAELSRTSANIIGTADFTVEAFIKLVGTSSGDIPTMFDYQRGFLGSNPNGFTIMFSFGSSGVYMFRGGSTVISSSTNLFDSAWHHVALSRVSGVSRMFVDGVQVGSSYTDTNNYNVSAGYDIRLGGGSRYDMNMNGWIDEFRFTVGVGRYTSNFTPTSTEFGTAASSGAVTLARTPTFSSNSNALVSFAAGTKQVFLTVPAAYFGAAFTGLLKAGDTATGAINWAATQTIASAGTTNIAGSTSNQIIVSGTTTITALGTIAAGAERTVQFSGALTLTHNATSLILPGAASITTAAGDVAHFVSLGSGNWRCIGYQKASGAAVVSSGGLSGLTAGRIPFATSSTAIADDSGLVWDNTNKRLGVGTAAPSVTIHAKQAVSGGMAGVISENSNAAGYAGFENYTTSGRSSFFTTAGPSSSFGGIYTAGTSSIGAVNGQVNLVSETSGVRIVTGGTATTNIAVDVDVNQNVTVGKTGGLATSATNGFPYIPSCAGTPSGVPTAKTGFAPMVWDRTNKKLYVYDAGWNAMN